MSYLLDTNIIVYHLGNITEAVALVSGLAPDGIALSIVSCMEIYQSTLRSEDPQDAETKLTEFLSAVPILPFSTSTARQCARLREQLAREGKRVRQRALDLLIAATALEHEVTPFSASNQGNLAGVHGSRTHLGTQRCAPTTVLKTAPLTGEAALPRGSLHAP